MIIQRINRTNPEKVFLIARNDETVFTKGQPVVFTFDGTRDGLDTVSCYTGDAAKSTLLAGLADSAIPAGSYGLVQCYGVRTDAVMLKAGTATNKNAAIGDAMVLHTAQDCLSGVAAGAVSAYLPGIVMGETMASSASTATTTGTVFLRLM